MASFLRGSLKKIFARDLFSSSSSLRSIRNFAQVAEAIAPAERGDLLPKMPPFDYTPPPYTGPRSEEILRKRSEFLSPSMFYFYKKPVRHCIFFLDFFSCLICIKRRSVCSDILSFFGEVFKGDLFHAILDPHSSLDPFELLNPHSSVLNTEFNITHHLFLLANEISFPYYAADIMYF